jgi:hypothetical protein
VSSVHTAASSDSFAETSHATIGASLTKTSMRCWRSSSAASFTLRYPERVANRMLSATNFSPVVVIRKPTRSFVWRIFSLVEYFWSSGRRTRATRPESR